LFVSLIAILLTQQSMSKEVFNAWGWRVPFLASILACNNSPLRSLEDEESTPRFKLSLR